MIQFDIKFKRGPKGNISKYRDQALNAYSVWSSDAIGYDIARSYYAMIPTGATKVAFMVYEPSTRFEGAIKFVDSLFNINENVIDISLSANKAHIV